ncbi:MAG: restriction endonuclease subunit S [Sulfuricurvum sp.]
MKQGWEVKKLGEVCKISTGKSNTEDAIENGEYAFFDRSKIIKKSSKYLFDCDAIIVAGEGQTFLPKFYSGKFDLHQRAYAIFNFNNNISIHYVFKFLIHFHKYFEEVAVGATAKSLRLRHFQDLEISFPSLPEQQRIVAILDEAFSAIEGAKANAMKNLKNSKELFDSYLQSVFENRGEGWEEKRLGEIAAFRNGMNFTKASKGEIIKIVGVRDFKKSFWVPFGYLESVTIDGKLNEIDFLNEGDILAVRSNGNPELIGRTLLAGEVSEKVSHSGFTIRIRLNTKNVVPIYLCRYLKTQKTRKELVDSGNGVGIKSLNQGSLSSLLIPIPPLSEQQTIVQKLDLLSTETKRLEAIYQQKIDNLEELKKSILQKAFNGELG